MSKLKPLIVILVGVVSGLAVGISGASASNGTQTAQFKTAYSDSFGVPWTCSGVHQVKKTGAVSDSETCTTPVDSPYGGFVAGTYTSNEAVYPNGYPGGCGGYAGGIPGSSNVGAYDYWVSDFPGFNACAQSWTRTFIDNGGGAWTVTTKANY